MTSPHAFDEMFGADKAYADNAGPLFGEHIEINSAYRWIQDWLEKSPPGLMAARRRQAELFFRRIGITFAVYGDPAAAERLIPFDIIPRILARAEWSGLEAGLIQRVGALNAFLADI
jgi:uncharacterized circularly permuted ATP-grasp superfamily protein